MPKKDFTGQTAAISKFLNRTAEPTEAEPSEPSKPSKVSQPPATSKPSKPRKPGMGLSAYPKVCIRLAYGDIEYLKQASWERHQDMTAYLRDLIHADRIANEKKNRSKGKP